MICYGYGVAPELDVSEIAVFHSIYFEAMRIIEPFWGRMVGMAYKATGLIVWRGVYVHQQLESQNSYRSRTGFATDMVSPQNLMYPTVRLFTAFVLDALRIIEPFWGRMVGMAYKATGLIVWRGVYVHQQLESQNSYRSRTGFAADIVSPQNLMYPTVRLFTAFVLDALRIIEPFWGRMVGMAYKATGLIVWRGVYVHQQLESQNSYRSRTGFATDMVSPQNLMYPRSLFFTAFTLKRCR